MGDAVAAACKSPVVVGTVAAGEAVVPSGIHYVPAVAAGIAVAEFVVSVVAAFVGAILHDALPISDKCNFSYMCMLLLLVLLSLSLWVLVLLPLLVPLLLGI